MLEFSSIYLGIIYFQTTQLNLSLQYFDKVLNINSENYNALVNKAAVLNKLDRNLEAKQLLDKALTIDPVALLLIAIMRLFMKMNLN